MVMDVGFLANIIIYSTILLFVAFFVAVIHDVLDARRMKKEREELEKRRDDAKSGFQRLQRRMKMMGVTGEAAPGAKQKSNKEMLAMIRSKYGASSREYKAMLEIVQTGKMSAPKDVGADLLLASKSAWSSKKKMMPGAAFAGMLSVGRKKQKQKEQGRLPSRKQNQRSNRESPTRKSTRQPKQKSLKKIVPK